MKVTTALLSLVALAAVGLAGYWFGSRAPMAPHDQATAPVAPAASAPRKVLYYRNPMGLPDTSPTPKKDPMGMDYLPVYAGEEEDGGAATGNRIRVSTEKIQKLGVRTEAAAMRVLAKTLRVAGRIEVDERRVATIAPKFEGYVERLHVNATGQPVARGQALFEVYSPELVAAQQEYLIAMQGMQAMKDAGTDARGGMQQLAESSLSRLRNWDLSAEQVDALVSSGRVSRTITFRSPVGGIVTEKKAMQGMRFMPGEALYQVTDLSAVWLVADVFERDIASVPLGASVNVIVDAYANQPIAGRITYVYPKLNAETRTIPVRVELPNPGQRLKPAMFAQVELPVGSRKPVLTVPDSAVIDSGTRRIVLVQLQEGRFEPREVELGQRGDAHVEVQRGVKEGEQVVVAANFLIDAESNLKAAIGGMAPAAQVAGLAHQADAMVEALDARSGTLTLHHGPVASLKWPAMTMDFKAANAAMLGGVKPGQKVRVEFVERGRGEWVITKIGAAGGTAKP